MMKNIITVTFILASLLFSFINANSQEVKNDIPFKKNAIYTDIGILPRYVVAMLNYERTLNQHTFKRDISSFIKFGLGEYTTSGIRGELIMTEYGFMLGKHNNHLELGVGGTYFIDGNMDNTFSPTGNIGWRFQKPGGHLILRSGVGFPEGAHIGIGFTF